MGERSAEIGRVLEQDSKKLFSLFGWTFVGQDISVDCSRANHKNPKTKAAEKKTHGIDTFYRFYNPFCEREELIIVECKHHQWSDFIPSNVNPWIEELANTIECTSDSQSIIEYSHDCVLTTGLILFKSSDNNYDTERAKRTFSEVVMPRRRASVMLLLADMARFEKWVSLVNEIQSIRKSNPSNEFCFIYPSIGGSSWDKRTNITPTYLFSDFVFTTYIQTKVSANSTEQIDVKAIFIFEKPTESSIVYLLDMIDTLQLESRAERRLEIHLYYYEDANCTTDYIQEMHSQYVNPKKPNLVCKILRNCHSSTINE